MGAYHFFATTENRVVQAKQAERMYVRNIVVPSKAIDVNFDA
jgi:hypothetical protein